MKAESGLGLEEDWQPDRRAWSSRGFQDPGASLSSNGTVHQFLWQPTPVFLPGKSHGQRSLAGYSPWGYKESDTKHRVTKHTCFRVWRYLWFSMKKWELPLTGSTEVSVDMTQGLKSENNRFHLLALWTSEKAWKKLDLPLAWISFLSLSIGHRNTTEFTAWSVINWHSVWQRT